MRDSDLYPSKDDSCFVPTNTMVTYKNSYNHQMHRRLYLVSEEAFKWDTGMSRQDVEVDGYKLHAFGSCFGGFCYVAIKRGKAGPAYNGRDADWCQVKFLGDEYAAPTRARMCASYWENPLQVA